MENSKKTYTTLPAAATPKLEEYFKNNNIAYSLIWGPELAEHPEAGEACYFRGHYIVDHTICVVTDMDPLDVTALAERLNFSRGKMWHQNHEKYRDA